LELESNNPHTPTPCGRILKEDKDKIVQTFLTRLKDEIPDAKENLKALIDLNKAQIKAGPLPVVNGDDIELMQLFQNLISNSLKFKSTFPPVIEIRAEEQKDHWRFIFSDNGIGFDTEDAQKVFEPFKRAHSGQNYEGTGLGLAICKRIIEHHSGKIWAQSTPGQGATFFFNLPKA
jgi:light-regulated signal transduction histidine kinase (bacteriophytochrome)